MTWFFLIGAILSEVTATISLKVAAEGKRAWYGVVTTGYVVAFTCLSFALQAGLSLGVAYGIWAASGVALTALISHMLFKEPLTRTMLLGIALIICGVLLIELGAGH